MLLHEIKEKLALSCQQHGVRRLQLFGSTARRVDTATSDVDLLVQFGEMSPSDYARHYFEFLHSVEDALDRPVDLLTPGSVRRPSLTHNLSRDSVLIYEAGG